MKLKNFFKNLKKEINYKSFNGFEFNSKKIKKNLDWKIKINLITGLEMTFSWYLNNLSYFKTLNQKDIKLRFGLKK